MHKHFSPGLPESVYEVCFIDELKSAGLSVISQIYLPVHYKGKDIGRTLKLDLLVQTSKIIWYQWLRKSLQSFLSFKIRTSFYVCYETTETRKTLRNTERWNNKY
ncbi:MAG: GxxExxY protein [Bacteroidales bacterium]|nr:GxxExxY protein [Bacteroidales bacterium]